MAYKIYAKKGRKTMPIKLESKHFYTNINPVYIELYKTNLNVTPSPTMDQVRGCGPNNDTIKIIHNTNNMITQRGTAENQRIGNKINLKGINMVISLYFVKDVIATYLSHSEAVLMKFNFRIMTVKFDQIMTSTDIARWYRETYIYTRNISITAGDNYPQQSNWMDKKRESTPWTGSFSILKDKKFVLDKNHTTTMINYNLGINKDVNFDNTTSKPTDNQFISNIYTFIIGPSNNFYDMDAVSQSKVENLSTGSIATWIIEANIKHVYYDM